MDGKRKKPPGKKAGLTERQKRFVAEYLIDMDGAGAAKRAGFSERNANVSAYKLLHRPAVQAELARQKAELYARLQMRAEDVLREYVKIARANITDFVTFDANGVKLHPSSERKPEELAAVAEVRSIAGQNGMSVSLKMHNKVEALTALGRHLGLFVERHEHNLRGHANVNFYLPDNGRRPGTD
jgi:phage terminase small subunit